MKKLFLILLLLWPLTSTAQYGHVSLDLTADQTFSGNIVFTLLVTFEGNILIKGAEGGDASLILDADEGDDDADTWTITSAASDNDLNFINHTNTRVTFH